MTGRMDGMSETKTPVPPPLVRRPLLEIARERNRLALARVLPRPDGQRVPVAAFSSSI